MKYGFDYKELDHILLTGAEALILTLDATSSVLEIPEVDEIRAAHEEFSMLYNDIFDET